MLLRSGKIRSFRVKVSQDSFGYLASIFPKMIDFSRRSLRTAFFPHPVNDNSAEAALDDLTPEEAADEDMACWAD